MVKYLQKINYFQIINRGLHILIWSFWFLIAYRYIWTDKLLQRFPFIKYLIFIPPIFGIIDLSQRIFGHSFPVYWPYCFDITRSNEERKVGIIGYLNLKCNSLQESSASFIETSLNDRFYYLNYIIFLFVILIRKNYGANSRTILNLVSIGVICGIIGSTILAVIRKHRNLNIEFQHLQTSFLSMNIIILVMVTLIYGTELLEPGSILKKN